MTNSASNKTNFKTKIFRDERDDNPERKLKIWKNRRPNVKNFEFSIHSKWNLLY